MALWKSSCIDPAKKEKKKKKYYLMQQNHISINMNIHFLITF